MTVVNIKPKIGYQAAQPNVSNPAEVNSYYDSLHLTNLDFFQLDVELKRFSKNFTWHSLMRPINLESLTMTAPTVNAYYEVSQNQIALPAGVMQYPFFHPDLPDYISYGAFGAIAGHEITHAFDSTGSMLDDKGRFREWWDKSTRANFNNKTKCFVNQYSKYYVTDDKGKQYKVNGRQTLGENIADAGGLSVAYAAWKKRDAKRPDPVLPGFENMTKEQVFFLAFASRSCAKARPQEEVRRIFTDSHAPSLTRIVGTVDNSAAFKEAFSCPQKQPTCEIW
jgi:endothelin-converting enzyme